MLILSYREKTELIFSTMFLIFFLLITYALIPSIFTDRIPESIKSKNYINLIIAVVLYSCWYFLTKFSTNYFVFDS